MSWRANVRRSSDSNYARKSSPFALDAKLADAIAKLGGGSLLTTTLLLFVQGEAGRAALVTAALTLLLLVAGTILSALFERWGAKRDAGADGLQAVLNETGT